MLKWVAGAAAVVSLLLASSQSSAQKLAAPDQPYAIRVGALWPNNHTIRSFTQTTWLDLGLDYTFGTTDQGNEWIAALDLGTTTHFNYWALQAIYMWRNSAMNGERHGFSYGLGAAAYILDPDQGDRTTEYGVPVVADWDLTQSVFLEGKYHWVASKTEADAFTLQLGYRF